MNHESPMINRDGSYSRDFTYIDNVILMNLLCLTTDNKEALNQVYNTAAGERNSLLELVELLKKYLCEYDPKIKEIEIKFGSKRNGDVPHSLASIVKANKIISYSSLYSLEQGLSEIIKIDFIFKKLN